MLLSLEEIKKGLDEKFLPLEPMLEGFRLVEDGLEESSLASCEARIGVKFPADFRAALLRYDFNNFTVGPVAFCATGNYLEELIVYNEGARWWGESSRPQDLIMIANSDPFAILLNVDTGEVLGMDPELGWGQSTKLAADFVKYLEGVGTAMLMHDTADDKDKLAQEIHEQTGSQDLKYWKSLVQ